jgi:hypothetical protein
VVDQSIAPELEGPLYLHGELSVAEALAEATESKRGQNRQMLILDLLKLWMAHAA